MTTMQIGSPTALSPSPRAWLVGGARPDVPTSNTPPDFPTLCRAPRAATMNALATVIFTDFLASGSWTVDWGDGQTTTNTFSQDDNNTLDIFAGHIYDYESVGHFDVNLSVTRESGEFLTHRIGGVDVVSDELPELYSQTLLPAIPNVFQAVTLTQKVKEGLTYVAGWSIDWGDGSPVSALSFSNTGVVIVEGVTSIIYTAVVSHTYVAPGYFVVTTYVVDTDGQQGVITAAIHVTDIPNLGALGGTHRVAFE
jgi:hypothetical protein